jgi:hypothetical protein
MVYSTLEHEWAHLLVRRALLIAQQLTQPLKVTPYGEAYLHHCLMLALEHLSEKTH